MNLKSGQLSSSSGLFSQCFIMWEPSSKSAASLKCSLLLSNNDLEVSPKYIPFLPVSCPVLVLSLLHIWQLDSYTILDCLRLGIFSLSFLPQGWHSSLPHGCPFPRSVENSLSSWFSRYFLFNVADHRLFFIIKSVSIEVFLQFLNIKLLVQEEINLITCHIWVSLSME